MELVAEWLINNNLAVLAASACVLLLTGLLFAYGFKATQKPPPFEKIAAVADDRKAASKKRKPKEPKDPKKTTANGHVQVAESPVKQKSPAKDSSTAKKEKKAPKKKETIEDIKNKKNKKSGNEKPLDYDDGDWETVPTKADKKKKLESPTKKDSSTIKQHNKKNTPSAVNKELVEIDKLAKEVVNKELRKQIKEKEHVEEEIATVIVEKPAVIIEKPVVIVEAEEKKEPKKKEKPRKEKEIVPAKENQVKSEGAPVFDELGDTWTEPKAKKSKKKARRDN